jgi:hypothetical protein
MKHVAGILVVVVAGLSIFALAQTGPSGVSIGIFSGGTCQAPAPGISALCLTSNGAIQQTVNGSPYAAPTNASAASVTLAPGICNHAGTGSAGNGFYLGNVT